MKRRNNQTRNSNWIKQQRKYPNNTIPDKIRMDIHAGGNALLSALGAQRTADEGVSVPERFVVGYHALAKIIMLAISGVLLWAEYLGAKSLIEDGYSEEKTFIFSLALIAFIAGTLYIMLFPWKCIHVNGRSMTYHPVLGRVRTISVSEIKEIEVIRRRGRGAEIYIFRLYDKSGKAVIFFTSNYENVDLLFLYLMKGGGDNDPTAVHKKTGTDRSIPGQFVVGGNASFGKGLAFFATISLFLFEFIFIAGLVWVLTGGVKSTRLVVTFSCLIAFVTVLTISFLIETRKNRSIVVKGQSITYHPLLGRTRTVFVSEIKGMKKIMYIYKLYDTNGKAVIRFDNTQRNADLMLRYLNKNGVGFMA